MTRGDPSPRSASLAPASEACQLTSPGRGACLRPPGPGRQDPRPALPCPAHPAPGERHHARPPTAPRGEGEPCCPSGRSLGTTGPPEAGRGGLWRSCVTNAILVLVSCLFFKDSMYTCFFNPAVPEAIPPAMSLPLTRPAPQWPRGSQPLPEPSTTLTAPVCTRRQPRPRVLRGLLDK